MDIINNVLVTTSDSLYNFCLAIHMALAIGNKTMNKYYNKTDSLEVYHIAIGV